VRKPIVAALVAALALPAAAQAAPPNPFGHACTPRDGVLFCPTASDADRVPSFDGVPIDVDVTLPGTGDGPFPTIVMMHGWGGNKGSFRNASPYGNVQLARRGYAVVTPSARGFGRSCGVADSRGAPGCAQGWIRLADQRYEGRDVQHLLGLLVDQRVTRPGAIGVTGISYGGIQSLNLARLRDRVRLPNGRFRPWRSPRGTRLRIRAAWPRWGASDLTYSLVPNGRFTDFGPVRAAQSREPGGVMKRSYNLGLYATGQAAGNYAPKWTAPFDADIGGWLEVIQRGEPIRGNELRIAREITTFHSFAGLDGPSAPLLVQNGWTDDLFPAPEALRVYRTYARSRRTPVTLQLGDLGHPRGQNKSSQDAVFERQGIAFLDAYLRGRGRPPRHRAVTAFTQTCPADAPAGGPFRARSWERLHPRGFTLAARGRQVVTSGGGNPATAEAIDPIGGSACTTVPSERAPGTAIVQRRVRRAFTMLGMPTVRATIRTRGRGGFLAARLWDVEGGEQTLVARGVYRLEDDQSGRIAFQLFGNGWRFARGHVAKLELVGSDTNFLRPSNFSFRVGVTKARVELPSR
jgi:fermentation-respiration switch protein FrsA (DUF1100 family)